MWEPLFGPGVVLADVDPATRTTLGQVKRQGDEVQGAAYPGLTTIPVVFPGTCVKALFLDKLQRLVNTGNPFEVAGQLKQGVPLTLERVRFGPQINEFEVHLLGCLRGGG